MARVARVLAGLFEIGWSVGLKMAQSPEIQQSGMAVAVIFMVVSGTLLWVAQKQIPLGTAYAVWTGIGAAGMFPFSVLVCGDPTFIARYVGVALILGGVITLKLAHSGASRSVGSGSKAGIARADRQGRRGHVFLPTASGAALSSRACSVAIDPAPRPSRRF